jgi:hypothetical protein
MSGVMVGKWWAHMRKRAFTYWAQGCERNEIQERDDIYIEPSSEAAYEKQRSSKILPNRAQRGTGKA